MAEQASPPKWLHPGYSTMADAHGWVWTRQKDGSFVHHRAATHVTLVDGRLVPTTLGTTATWVGDDWRDA